MVYCVAFNCKNNSSNKGLKVSFFRFPNDEKVKAEWVQKIKRKGWKPTAHSRLCSEHFHASCFDDRYVLASSMGITPGVPRLKPNAIPTIFNFDNGENRCPSETTHQVTVKSKNSIYFPYSIFVFYSITGTARNPKS